MLIEDVRLPRWTNADSTCLVCEVLMGGEWHPFSAVPSGDLPHVHEVFARCIAGEFGDIAAYTPVPLEVVQARMWEKIKAERDRRKENGGYPAAGKWFHSDVYSRTQIIALVQLGANLPADIQWKTMDGTFLLLTPTIVGQMFQAAIAQDNATFKAAEVHKAAMEASADPASYDYSTGWPAIYGG